MDKMTNNEFYNRINSKFLYLFEVKFPHLSLKMNFSSRWSQKSYTCRSKKFHIRNEFYNEFHFCCFGCNLVQIPL